MASLSAVLAALPSSFYAPSASVVAPALLGHFLIRQTPDGLCGGVIVETEAYLWDDPACHGYQRETPRNRTMYGPPGHAYVYLIYGLHHCVNAVCQPAGRAEAVLIRAIATTFGEEQMQRRRPVQRPLDLTNGPAKLCAALEIDRRLDGVDLTRDDSPIWIARHPGRRRFLGDHGPVTIARRIGITRAADLPLRFFVRNNPFVSRREV